MENIPELYSSLNAFPELWKRVTEMPPKNTFSNEATLEHFIREEYCTSQFYASLAYMFPNKSRTELISRSNDAKRRLRRLRAEYFIRTGVTLTPSDKCPAVTGKLASLRSVMARQRETAAEYERASSMTDCPILRELFRTYGKELSAAAALDRALLIENFQT